MAEATPVPPAGLPGSGSRDASATPCVSPQRHEVSEHPVRKMSRAEKESFSAMSSNAVKRGFKSTHCPKRPHPGQVWVSGEVFREKTFVKCSSGTRVGAAARREWREGSGAGAVLTQGSVGGGPVFRRRSECRPPFSRRKQRAERKRTGKASD